MRLVIIADIHDNLVNLNKVIHWSHINQINKIICLGDITTTETLAYLAANFTGEIFVVQGNCEIYQPIIFSNYPNLTNLATGKIVNLDNLNIGCCHEPEQIDILLKLDNPDIIFYGHTHKPWLEKRGQTMIINPGNVAGVFHQATFAVFDTENHKLELKILAEIK